MQCDAMRRGAAQVSVRTYMVYLFLILSIPAATDERSVGGGRFALLDCIEEKDEGICTFVRDPWLGRRWRWGGR